VFEPANLGSNSKHTNHDTIENDKEKEGRHGEANRLSLKVSVVNALKIHRVLFIYYDVTLKMLVCETLLSRRCGVEMPVNNDPS
jgi:hypothetical protein